MLEHRYEFEKYIEKENKTKEYKDFLIDGKYLKSEVQVHHINLDYQDNRIENLHLYKKVKEHNNVMKSLYSLVKALLDKNVINFREGKYYISYI